MNILKRKGRACSNWPRSDGPRNITAAENKQYTGKQALCALSLKLLSNCKNYKLYTILRQLQLSSVLSVQILRVLRAGIVTILVVTAVEIVISSSSNGDNNFAVVLGVLIVSNTRHNKSSNSNSISSNIITEPVQLNLGIRMPSLIFTLRN